MRRTVLLLAGITLLGGCGEPTATGEITASARAAAAAEHVDIAALRAATARFHRFAVAVESGYDTQFPPGCFESSAGAMGLHYLNATKVGTLEVTEPQLVMYEPQQDGTRRLLGFEYIVPGVPTDVPPVLFGKAFEYNAQFGVWALHVWAWKHNPEGMFASWNPNVTCEHAPVVTELAHH